MVDFSYLSCTIVHSMSRPVCVVLYELGHNTTLLTESLELARYLCVLQIDGTEYVYFKYQNAHLGTSDSTILTETPLVMQAALGMNAKINFGKTHRTDAQIDAIIASWYKATGKRERNDYAFVKFVISKLSPDRQALRNKLHTLKEFNHLRKFQKRFNPFSKRHSAASKCWSLLCWLPPFLNVFYTAPCLLLRECNYSYPEESILDMIENVPGRDLKCVDFDGNRRQLTDEQLRSFRGR